MTYGLKITTSFFAGVLMFSAPSFSQTPPSEADIAGYQRVLIAAHNWNANQISGHMSSGTAIEERDNNDRTAVHIAAFASHEHLFPVLKGFGFDMNALEAGRYDAVTIAAVANDVPVLKAALEAGNRADNITSYYDGTALIAAAHLGHHEVVKVLIDAGAPLDHINNLNWTALIEAVVLGDGGPNHQETVRLLVAAGADQTITDSEGRTAYRLAKQRGYEDIAKLLKETK